MVCCSYNDVQCTLGQHWILVRSLFTSNQFCIIKQGILTIGNVGGYVTLIKTHTSYKLIYW